MNDPLAVGLSLSARAWRSAVQRHCRDHVADLALVLVRDGSEVLDGGVDVVVVDDDTSWLSPSFVGQARESGIVVVGIYDPMAADGHGERFLRQVGIDVAIPSSIASDQLVERLRSLRPDPDLAARFGALVGSEDDRVPAPSRHVLAVGGPSGAGATEVSIALCRLLAERGGPDRRPLLLDVDETTPSIARRLGLGLHPHLITAIDTLRGEATGLDGERLDLDDCLARPAVGRARLPFDVVVGLAARDDWALARPNDVGELLVELTARWAVVVARLGPQLEDLSRHVDRFGVSRTVAARAQRLVGVCDASPIGLLRFVDWLVDAVGVVGEAPIDVVLNRAPASPASRHQLVSQLRQITGDRIGQVIVVRRDRRIERASWDATVPARGPFLRALSDLLDEGGRASASDSAAGEGAAA